MNRWHAFAQLILTRLRQFYREPEAIFWVYGFPLLLAVGLGLAFSGGAPKPPKVDIQATTDDAAAAMAKLLAADQLDVELHPADEGKRRLLRGRTDPVV